MNSRRLPRVRWPLPAVPTAGFPPTRKLAPSYPIGRGFCLGAVSLPRSPCDDSPLFGTHCCYGCYAAVAEFKWPVLPASTKREARPADPTGGALSLPPPPASVGAWCVWLDANAGAGALVARLSIECDKQVGRIPHASRRIFSHPLPRLLPGRLSCNSPPRQSVSTHLKRLVGATGFEPATSRPPVLCAI